MKKSTTILFILFFILTYKESYADEFEVKKFKHEALDLKARTNRVLDVNNQPCALLLIQTSVIDLGVSANTGIEGNIEFKNGEYWVYLPDGTRRISFFAKGITKLDYNFPERITGNEVYVMQLAVKRDVQPVGNIKLGYLSINTVPSRANVYVDGTSTGSQSFMNTALLEGRHLISLSLPGYLPHDTIISISENVTQALHVEFKKNPAIESIRSSQGSSCLLAISIIPEGNTGVAINGEVITTPLYDGIPLRQGKNYITVFKEHYIPVDTVINVTTQPSVNLQIILQPVFGTLLITSEPPADIIIDKNKVGTGSQEVKLCQGYHLIELSKENYQTSTHIIHVKNGQVDSLLVRLLKKTASLSVTTSPVGAKVVIGDSAAGNTPLLISDLPLSQQRITIEYSGYATVIKELDLINDMTYQLNEELLLGRRLKVTSFPKGSEVSYNSHLIGKTPFFFSFPIQEVILIAENEGYEAVIDTISIGSIHDSIHFDLTKSAAGPPMVFVKGGCYKRKQGWTYFDVCLDDFYISKFEITNKEFCSFLNAVNIPRNGVLNNRILIGFTGSQIQYSLVNKQFEVKKGFENKPVNYITWYGAQEYCNYYQGRLPTEAEWLYAAQEMGISVTKFSGGDDLDEVGWYYKNS